VILVCRLVIPLDDITYTELDDFGVSIKTGFLLLSSLEGEEVGIPPQRICEGEMDVGVRCRSGLEVGWSDILRREGPAEKELARFCLEREKDSVIHLAYGLVEMVRPVLWDIFWLDISFVGIVIWSAKTFEYA
jgi:hypothetical protein